MIKNTQGIQKYVRNPQMGIRRPSVEGSWAAWYIHMFCSKVIRKRWDKYFCHYKQYYTIEKVNLYERYQKGIDK